MFATVAVQYGCTSLLRFIMRNLQRLQEAQILRRHIEFRRLVFFLQNLLVHLDVQRFQEAPVSWE